MLLLALDVADAGATIAIRSGQVATGFGIQDQHSSFQSRTPALPKIVIGNISPGEVVVVWVGVGNPPGVW